MLTEQISQAIDNLNKEITSFLPKRMWIINQLVSYQRPVRTINSNLVLDLNLILSFLNDNEKPKNIREHVNKLLSIQSTLKPLALVISAVYTFETLATNKSKATNESLDVRTRKGIAKALTSPTIAKESENLEDLLKNLYNPKKSIPELTSNDEYKNFSQGSIPVDEIKTLNVEQDNEVYEDKREIKEEKREIKEEQREIKEEQREIKEEQQVFLTEIFAMLKEFPKALSPQSLNYNHLKNFIEPKVNLLSLEKGLKKKQRELSAKLEQRKKFSSETQEQENKEFRNLNGNINQLEQEIKVQHEEIQNKKNEIAGQEKQMHMNGSNELIKAYNFMDALFKKLSIFEEKTLAPAYNEFKGGQISEEDMVPLLIELMPPNTNKLEKQQLNILAEQLNILAEACNDQFIMFNRLKNAASAKKQPGANCLENQILKEQKEILKDPKKDQKEPSHSLINSCNLTEEIRRIKNEKKAIEKALEEQYPEGTYLNIDKTDKAQDQRFKIRKVKDLLIKKLEELQKLKELLPIVENVKYKEYLQQHLRSQEQTDKLVGEIKTHNNNFSSKKTSYYIKQVDTHIKKVEAESKELKIKIATLDGRKQEVNKTQPVDSEIQMNLENTRNQYVELLIQKRKSHQSLDEAREKLIRSQYDKVVTILNSDNELDLKNRVVQEFNAAYGSELRRNYPEIKTDLDHLINEKLPSTDFLKAYAILNNNIFAADVNPINIYHFMITAKEDDFLDEYVSRMGKKFGSQYEDMSRFYLDLLEKKPFLNDCDADALKTQTKNLDTTLLAYGDKLPKSVLFWIGKDSRTTILAITMILFYGSCTNQSWYESSPFNFADRTQLAKAIFGEHYSNLTNDVKNDCFIKFYHKVLKAIEFNVTLESNAQTNIIDGNKNQKLAEETMQKRGDFLSTKTNYPISFKRTLLEGIVREIYFNKDNLEQLDISQKTSDSYQSPLKPILENKDDKSAIYEILNFVKKVFDAPATNNKRLGVFDRNTTYPEKYRLKRELEVRMAQAFGENNHNSNKGTNFRNKFDALLKAFQPEDDAVFNP